MADELGDFFAEIQQVEEHIDEYKQSYSEVKSHSGDITGASEEKQQQPVIVNEVISKPAEILPKPLFTPQYPLFTYEAIPITTSSNSYDSYHDGNGPSSSTSSTGNHFNAPSSSNAVPYFPRQNKKFVRKAADEVWIDESLQEWPENDYRIFVGDLGKEVTTEMLAKPFQIYKSFAKAKVIRSQHENKPRGYGFVSFLDPNDCIRAIREMNGKYLGSRPMTVKRSDWKDRDIKEVQKKSNKKRKIQESLGLI